MRRQRTADAGRQATPPGLPPRETGAIRKKWKDRLPVALLFPNVYAVGMSNLGFQLVYKELNRKEAVVAERFFLPQDGKGPRSIESDRLLADFPILCCSLSFEDDFPNLISLLLQGNIPPLTRNRAEPASPPSPSGPGVASPGRPLIIAGGVACSINPEPLAPFVDLVIIGEAEPVLPQLIELLLELWHRVDRQTMLHRIAVSLPGCYVPEFYTIRYNKDSTLAAMTPRPDLAGLPARIKRVVMTDVPKATAHSQLLTPEAEFADLYMAELGRGCSRGCRFCAAGFVYRPPRLWPAEVVINGLTERPDQCQRVGLLGMEMARPDDLDAIAGYLRTGGCALSFSSLRADAITENLLALLGESRLKSAAIAPDGGSERLRRVINKGIIQDDLLAAAAALAGAGIMNLKLYFMIGLPTETMADMEELVSLTLAIKQRVLAASRARGRLGKLTLSVNCFVPKPWTPFQFHPFEAVTVLKQKIRYLRTHLGRIPNISIKADRPEHAYFQAMLARGDRRLAPLLLDLAQHRSNWQQTCRRLRIRPEDYAMRPRGREEVLPWDFIDHAINRDYLWQEYQRAHDARMTPPCDPKRCRRCGVCDGD